MTQDSGGVPDAKSPQAEGPDAQSAGHRHPEPTVGALILNARGEILLVRSHKWGDRWTIAGGHVEAGETLEGALRREISEEVGLEITVVGLLMVQEAIFSGEFWKRRHFVFFDYLCRSKGGEPRVDGVEIQSARWVEPEEALRLGLDSFTRRMVEVYVAGGGARLFPGGAPRFGTLRPGRAGARRALRPRPAGRR